MIRLINDEDPKYGDDFTIDANGLDIIMKSDLRTEDEVAITLEIPRNWELLYQGGSDHNLGQLVLRRII